MTDLQRLIEWHQNEAAYHREISQIETHADIAAETARILSVLPRVRECHKWTTGETDGSQYIGDCYMHIKCDPDTLRDLAELLGGGKRANSSRARFVGTTQKFCEKEQPGKA